MKALLAGWFSFEGMGASAGDLLACDLTGEWLESAGHRYHLALAPPFSGGVDWREVDPAEYSDVIFVCGPFGNGPPVDEFLERFPHCRLVGLNVSMLEPLERWNPFDALFERDSSQNSQPDMVFLSRQSLIPVVGVVRIEAQPEYGEHDRHGMVDAAIDTILSSRPVASVPIDTVLRITRTGLCTSSAVESVIARMDSVITTRLHGMVLALKHGVPAVVIDSVARGAKVARQAETIGWPVCLVAEEFDEAGLLEAFDYCLTERAKEEAMECSRRAQRLLASLPRRFLECLEALRTEARKLPSAHFSNDR